MQLVIRYELMRPIYLVATHFAVHAKYFEQVHQILMMDALKDVQLSWQKPLLEIFRRFLLVDDLHGHSLVLFVSESRFHLGI